MNTNLRNNQIIFLIVIIEIFKMAEFH